MNILKIFKKKDLITRRAEANQNLNKAQRNYDKTSKPKYSDKVAYYQGEIDGIDKALSKPSNSTKIDSTKISNTINHSKKIASDNNLLNQNNFNSKTKRK